jgi:hypothetical protein
MTQEQQDSVYMYDAVNQVLNTNKSVWTANTAFTSAVNAFGANINSINTAGTNQKTNVVGVTLSKAQQKDALISAAYATATAGRAYATVSNNAALKQACKISHSDLRDAAEQDLTGICQNLHDAVNPFIGSMAGYGINAGTQTALQTAITAFISLIGTPRSTQTASIAATQVIETTIRNTNLLLADGLDGLMEQYSLTNVIFYKQYHAARKLAPHGHRTTVTVKGLIQNSNYQGINKAHVQIVEEASRKKITDASGAYKFMRLKPGTYTVEVVINGFVTQSKSISIATAGTTELDFVMQTGGLNSN